ncbi:OX-2 membrane glycoprotein-like isoform X2 [Myxocyprinus asiaticus]|uniref:OX-2 membrane glycoprotein-like isoform X2 n=1 Tax=Myxocyprinus asiaticus TaxID=70543 RepID=UPI002222B5E1|nr:OX-2 membrane glycoprotein-like isoform X2 [Myxocyprinus asiaticus]
MLCLLFILSFIIGAYPSDIVAQGDKTALFGQDASLSCTLPSASGVKQVTWQRVRADERVQTLATFSERFKDHVDDKYVGKVSFTMALFNSTSIVIKNVTFEDEACYICSFKVYPLGPKRETLCLTVKGISKITATVNPAPSSELDIIVSCSATGKPTPILKWKSTEKELNLKLLRSHNFTTLNNDSSSTTTSNLTLPMSQFQGKYVECLAESGSMEDSLPIYVPGDDKVNNVTSRSYFITIWVFVIMVIFSIVIITVICLHARLNGSMFRMKSTESDLSLKQLEC